MSDGFLHRYFLNNGDKKIHKWIHYFDMYNPHQHYCSIRLLFLLQKNVVDCQVEFRIQHS